MNINWNLMIGIIVTTIIIIILQIKFETKFETNMELKIGNKKPITVENNPKTIWIFEDCDRFVCFNRLSGEYRLNTLP